MRLHRCSAGAESKVSSPPLSNGRVPTGAGDGAYFEPRSVEHLGDSAHYPPSVDAASQGTECNSQCGKEEATSVDALLRSIMNAFPSSTYGPGRPPPRPATAAARLTRPVLPRVALPLSGAAHTNMGQAESSGTSSSDIESYGHWVERSSVASQETYTSRTQSQQPTAQSLFQYETSNVENPITLLGDRPLQLGQMSLRPASSPRGSSGTRNTSTRRTAVTAAGLAIDEIGGATTTGTSDEDTQRAVYLREKATEVCTRAPTNTTNKVGVFNRARKLIHPNRTPNPVVRLGGGFGVTQIPLPVPPSAKWECAPFSMVVGKKMAL